MSTIFKTPFNYVPDDFEYNSGELVTEPGQSFTTREIYDRFITTGRVLGASRLVEYDTDSIKDPGFDDYIERPLDLTDIDSHIRMLHELVESRKEQARKVAEENDKLRKKLAENAASQGTSVAE